MIAGTRYILTIIAFRSIAKDRPNPNSYNRAVFESIMEPNAPAMPAVDPPTYTSAPYSMYTAGLPGLANLAFPLGSVLPGSSAEKTATSHPN